MSDYPSAPPYGANYPGPPPNAPYPPPYPNNTYAQPGSRYQGPPQYAQNYDASVNTYGYNQHTSSGYGAAGPAPSGVPLSFQGWNQNSTSLPTYTSPQGGMAYPNYGGGTYSSASHYPGEIQQSFPQHLQYNLGGESDANTADYDDAYAPTNPGLVSYGTSQYLGAGGSGYLNPAQRSSAYSRAQNHSPVQSSQSNNDYYPREATHVVHQPSGSYPQYESAPGAVDLNDASGMERSYNTYSSNQVASQDSQLYPSARPRINRSTKDQNGPVDTSILNSQTKLTSPASPQDKPLQHISFSTTTPSRPKNFTPAAEASTTPSNTSIQPTGQTTDPKAQKPIVEARKEAQAAILNLYPFQIGFRSFVDEGFDEHIVGRVFDDLGLTRSSSAKSVIESRLSPDHPTTKQAPVATVSIKTSEGDNNQAPVKEPLGPKTNSEIVQVDSQDQETRALNKAAAPNSATITTSAPPPKPSAPTEKERKLQMKMEALRKSREQRAQKAAVPPTNPPASTEKRQQLHLKMEALRKSREQGTQKIAATNEMSVPNSVISAALTGDKPADEFEQSAPRSTPGVQMTNVIPDHIRTQVPAAAYASQSTSQSTAQPTTAHQRPSIPGLFLSPNTTNSAQNAFASSAKYGTAAGIHRKRPVAADFDTPTSTAPPKRPFGQGRYETPLVINVTDEEQDSDDEDLAMEIESSADHNSPVLSAKNASGHRNASMQNLAVLTNLASRKPFTPPPVSSPSSTPTTRKSTIGKPEVLQEKEFAIEALRKRIAEAEAAKALKRAKRVADGTETPRTADSSGDDARSVDKDIAKKIEASVQIQQKLNTAEVNVSLVQKRLAEAQAAELKKVAELEQSEADQTRLRREQISTELPRVDAEVQKNQLKLELLRSEIARIESAVQQKLEEKQRMADELERLGQEAEERLQAEQDKLQSLTDTDVPIASAQTQSPDIEMDVDGSSPPSPTILQPSRYPSEHSHAAAEIVGQLHNPSANSSSEPEFQLGTVITKESDISHEQSTVHADNYTATESHVQQTEETESASASPAEGGNTIVNDSLALEQSRSVSESVSTPMEVDSRSPSYSPVLDRTLIVASERDDDYEPPDAKPPVGAPSVTGSPPFSPAPPKAISGVNLENNKISLEPAANEDVTEAVLTKVNGEVHALSNEDSRKLTKPTQIFTPYESPLKRFHGFLFHPAFGREVPGGLRSLTYSHKIDPMTELCPWEMAGGACNDETCEYQHIRDIRLPDDDILKFLGSQDGFSGDERVRFIDGLKDALGAIRERKIRDFDTIAQEILAYRRRFLGDSSKILALEGTAI